MMKDAATPGAVESIHERYVRGRRVRRLRELLAPMIAAGDRVLDVGSGDGRLSASLASAGARIEMTGVDVLVRPDAMIPTAAFDGRTLPFGDRSFDTVLFVDVLHHADDAVALLTEASRVARRQVIVKDHLRAGPLAWHRLAFMDRVGNRRHGVAIPCNYLDESGWAAAFAAAGLCAAERIGRLKLYPPPFSLAFDARLQVVFRLAHA